MAEGNGLGRMPIWAKAMLVIAFGCSLVCYCVIGHAVYEVIGDLTQTAAAVLMLSTTGGSG